MSRSAYLQFTRKLTCFLGRYYQPDLRALSLMRIAVALVLLADLLIRFSDLGAHYSDQGIWPTKLVPTLGWKGGYWSMHNWTGALIWQKILFGIQIAAALGLMLGFRTTLCCFVSWYLLVSLHNRNVYVLQSGDDLLRLVLFFGLFLPWHRHYSLDRNRRGFFPPVIFFYVSYLLLIASVYLFSVLLKSSPEWRGEGTAVYYALSLEQLRLPYSGDLIFLSPALMKLLTWLVMALEALIPLLILVPSRRPVTRNLAFIFILLLHTGIATTLYVGIFPFIGVASGLGLMRFSTKDKAVANPFAESIFKWWLSGFAVLISTTCLLINLGNLPSFPYQMHPTAAIPANMLRLDQYWGMFSPSVLKKDGWFVYQGIDKDGKEWDLRLNREEVDFQKPVRILSLYKNDRWRKLAENMQNDNFTFLRPQYARYILREWNTHHPEKPMVMMNLYYMEKTNLADYRTGEVSKLLYCVTDGR
jgi:hypothetical protein